MHVNISRDSFDAQRQFLRVVQDQGGVLLDADGNEQAAILLRQLQALAVDLFGRTWGPADGAGFDIALAQGNSDLTIKKGRYYVDGLPAYADEDVPYLKQSYLGGTTANPGSLPPFPFGVYLDVWERHLTGLELEDADKDPGLEQLGGSSRTQLVWQVRTQHLEPDSTALPELPGLLNVYLTLPGDKPTLRARPVTVPPAPPTPGHAQCPSTVPAGYTGLENQLYRVEVHSGGPLFSSGDPKKAKTATFKWSRDNGAVTYPIKTLSGKGDHLHVTLKSAGLDDYSRLSRGDWVEYLDESITLGYNALDDKQAEPSRALPLLVVTHVDPLDPTTVELSASHADASGLPSAAGPKAFLRRWDQRPPARPPAQAPTKGIPYQSPLDNALLAIAADDTNDREVGWFRLENGVMIKFEGSGNLQRGDYWLIPARVATAAVLWFLDHNNEPKAQPPRGLGHHYAPLRVFKDLATGKIDQSNSQDCRKVLVKAKLDNLFTP